MNTYKICYCLDSKKIYRSSDDAPVVSDLGEAFKILELLEEENDTLRIYLLNTKDILVLRPEKNKTIFLEIDTAIGGILSKDISLNEAKEFLRNIPSDFEVLEDLGFESSSI